MKTLSLKNDPEAEQEFFTELGAIMGRPEEQARAIFLEELGKYPRRKKTEIHWPFLISMILVYAASVGLLVWWWQA